MERSFRNAIGSYYENSPSAIKQYPQKLEQLLLDERFPNIKRHIRKLYQDPITHSDTWGIEVQQGQIIGIYSLSEQKPIKKLGFSSQYENFSEADNYTEWKFIYQPGTNPVSVKN